MKSLGLLALALILLPGCAHSPAEKKPASAKSFTTPKLTILDQQVKANPQNAQAYSNRGYTLALLGQKDPARADLRKALELNPNAPMHNGAGWAYFNIGDYDEALRVWVKAAEMSNNRSRYDYYSLVLGYWGVGNLEKAMENYQLAVEREPKFGQYATLQERTAEWTALERRAIHEIYVIWSKTWRP